MKINSQVKTIFIIKFIALLAVSNPFKLGNSIAPKPADDRNIESSKVDTIREILILSLKKGVTHNKGSPVETCISQMTTMKHMPDLVDFWALLKKIFDQNSPRPYMTVKEYFEFIHKVGKNEKLENGIICEDLFSKNLATDEELQNRGKIARSHIDPLLQNKISVEVKGKNFITAFTGVHRFSRESDILIPKLNQKAKHG